MNNDFTFQKMLTCIGNKRKLIGKIEGIITKNIIPRLNKNTAKIRFDFNENNDHIKLSIDLSNKATIFDGFAGSSVVSRSLSQFADIIHTNDLELYSSTMARCFLNKPTDTMKKKIKNHIDQMNIIANNGPYNEGIITKNYSPKDTNNIKIGERCFYTHENALIIDTLRKYIDDHVEEELFDYCITPLLIKSSIHANTAGVFKGFYKDKKTHIGKFGGSKNDDNKRITLPIHLELPIWSNYDFNANIYNKDINILIDELPNNIDITYLDPPYNQHPYSSNYFMLNLIINNKQPNDISDVAGIPNNWTRSDYNYKKKAIIAMKDLIQKTMKKSKYILLSYNNEGIIPLDEWDNIFQGYSVEEFKINYDAYKGSRNLKDRSNKVIEIMYLIY